MKIEFDVVDDVYDILKGVEMGERHNKATLVAIEIIINNDGKETLDVSIEVIGFEMKEEPT